MTTSRGPRRKESKEDSPTASAARVVGLALNVVVAGFLFGFLGHWVGTKVGAADVLAVLGAFVGAAAGFYSLYAHLTERPVQDRESDNR